MSFVDACSDPSCADSFADALEHAKALAAEKPQPCGIELISGCGVDTLIERDLAGSLRNYDSDTGRLIGWARYDDIETRRYGCKDVEFHAGARRPTCPAETRRSLCPADPQQSGPLSDEDAGT